MSMGGWMNAMHIAIVRAILRQLSKHIIMNDIQLRRYSVQVFRLRVFHCIRHLRGIHAGGQLAKCHCFKAQKPCSPRACRPYIYRTGMMPKQFLSPNPRIPNSPSLPRGPAAISIKFAFVWSPGFGSIRGPDKLLTSGVVFAYRLPCIVSKNIHGPSHLG